MKRDLGLRELPGREAAMRNRLLSAGLGASMSLATLTRGVPYLEFQAQQNRRACKVWLALQAVLEHWLDSADVPGEMIAPATAHAYVNSAFHTYGLPPLREGLTLERPLRILSGEQLDTPLYRWLDAPVECFLDVLPAPPAAIARGAWDDLPLRLDWIHGQHALDALSVSRLARGDLVRLPAGPGEVRAGAHVLCLFRYLENVLHTMPVESPRSELAPATVAPVTPTAVDLPVQVSFRLARLSVSVGELSALQSGYTLQLGRAKPMVELLVGERVIATGELVRLDGELAVEIESVALRACEPPAPAEASGGVPTLPAHARAAPEPAMSRFDANEFVS